MESEESRPAKPETKPVGRNSLRFKLGLVCLIGNFPLGVLGWLFAGWRATATGQLAFWTTVGAVISALSWIILGLGVYLAGPEGVAYAKKLKARMLGRTGEDEGRDPIDRRSPAGYYPEMPAKWYDSIRVTRYSAKSQFMVGIIMISVLPLMAFWYVNNLLLTSDSASQMLPWQLTIYLFTLCAGISGFLLLRRHPNSIEEIRKHLEDIVRAELPEKTMTVKTADDLEAVKAYTSIIIEGLRSKAITSEHEKTLEISKRCQKDKQDSLNQMCTGLAHDLNNILAAILGNTCIVLKQMPESQSKEHARQIEASAMRAVELTNQLLAYTGRIKFEVNQYNISAIITDLSDALQKAIGKGVELKLSLSPDVPAAKGDINQIKQSILSLVRNASESISGKHGIVEIRTGAMSCTGEYLAAATFADGAEPGEFVFVEVADTGEGISPRVAPRIFDPFFTTKLRARGLGLGAVLGIARGHAGAIVVNSEPGKGSTFRILLPVEGPKLCPF